MKKKIAKPEMGYYLFEHRHCVTIQPLYRDTVGWKTSLTGEKAVSRYKVCIVTEVAKLVRKVCRKTQVVL